MFLYGCDEIFDRKSFSFASLSGMSVIMWAFLFLAVRLVEVFTRFMRWGTAAGLGFQLELGFVIVQLLFFPPFFRSIALLFFRGLIS